MTSATTDRRHGLVGSVAVKAPVDCATTSNITLSGEQSIDGVTTSSSRVLVKNQTNGVENGIYDSSYGTWTRAVDFDGTYDAKRGTYVLVGGGSQSGQFWEVTTANPITIGSTSLAWGLSLTASMSTLSFLQAGTGAVARSAQDKMRDWVHAKDMSGVDATGATDSTTGLQNAINAGLRVDFGGPDCTYKVIGTITLRSGQWIRGDGATIQQYSNNTEIFNYVAKSDITILGVVGRGVGGDYSGSDASRAVFAYGGTSGDRITVGFCKFYDFSYTPIRCAANNHVTFSHNYVYGPGTAGSGTRLITGDGVCYGFLADSTCTDVHVLSNHFTKTAQGVRFEGTTRASIVDNDIYDIPGQHGIYIGKSTGDLTVQANRITTVAAIGIKVQADNTGNDNNRVAIIGNTITNAGSQGIAATNGGGATAQAIKNRGLTITGNTIKTVSDSAINVQNTIGGVVSGNVVDTATKNGVYLSAASRITVVDNVIENCGLSGIRDGSPCTQIILGRNQIRNCATTATVGDKFGILAQDMTEWTIDDNEISDSSAGPNTQYGIYLVSGDQTTVTLTKNRVLNASDAGLRTKNATDAMRVYRNNYWAVGSVGATYNEPALPTLTPAATTMVVPQGYDAVLVAASATAMTTIPPGGHAGRTVRFICVGVSTFTDGGNLKLAGNFVTTADDVLTMSCDGVNWYEAARSVN